MSLRIITSKLKCFYFYVRVLHGFREMTRASSFNPEAFIGNPVNSFLLIKQLSIDLKLFVDTLSNFEKIQSNKLMEVIYNTVHEKNKFVP